LLFRFWLSRTRNLWFYIWLFLDLRYLEIIHSSFKISRSTSEKIFIQERKKFFRASINYSSSSKSMFRVSFLQVNLSLKNTFTNQIYFLCYSFKCCGTFRIQVWEKILKRGRCSSSFSMYLPHLNIFITYIIYWQNLNLIKTYLQENEI